MPLNKDEKGGGTNTDGSLNLTYCSRCYQSGAFTRPDITAKEMQALVKGKMKEMGFPAPIAWLFTLNIPRLERLRNG